MMVKHWDEPNNEPMYGARIIALEDNADSPDNKLGALMFVLWSVFMMALGFMIAIMVQGHIVFR